MCPSAFIHTSNNTCTNEISFQIIIYSCTKTGLPASSSPAANRNTQSAKMEILDDQRRLTVAITRAKHKLILIGDAQTLECHTPFRCLLENMSGMNKMNLVEGQHGFAWSNVMRCLNDVLAGNNSKDEDPIQA